MGLFDNMSAAVNRGTAAAGRTGRTARLRMQLNDLMRQRNELAARLGSSLYEETRTIPHMRAGREDLYDGIAAIDQQRVEIQDRLDEIEREAQAAQEAARVFCCPRCGTRVLGSQGFCSGCGMPVADIRSAASVDVESVVSSGLTCSFCGAPLEEGDVFCMSCGARQS